MNKINKKKNLIFIVLLLLIFVSCGKKINTIFKNEKDIKIITSDKSKLIEIDEKLYSINKVEGNFLTNPSEIELYNDVVYILDKKDNCIYIFNKNGNFLTKIGRKGKGPGEFAGLKDFTIHDNSLFCLDKYNYTITKFRIVDSGKNLDFVYKKHIPEIIVENISLENIASDEEGLIISGFCVNNVKNSIPLCYKFTDELKLINKFMSYEKIGGNGEKSFQMNLIYSGNILGANNTNIFLGMLKGNNLLYRYDLKQNEFVYKIIKKTLENRIEYTDKEKGKRHELYSLYNIVDIYVCENFVVTSENAGGLQRNPLEIPDSYFNKISFYSLDGESLFSFRDESIPYCFYGLNCAVEKIEDGFNLYITASEEGLYIKYKINVDF